MQVPLQKLFCFYCWPSRPEAKQKQSFAASCVVNRHPQMTAGRNRANALPAVPPVRFPLLPCDWKSWIHFLWFQTPPEETSEPAQTCHRGIMLLLPPLAELWDKRTMKERKAWERGKDLFCLQVFRAIYVMHDLTTEQLSDTTQTVEAAFKSFLFWLTLLWGWVGSDYLLFKLFKRGCNYLQELRTKNFFPHPTALM